MCCHPPNHEQDLSSIENNPFKLSWGFEDSGIAVQKANGDVVLRANWTDQAPDDGGHEFFPTILNLAKSCNWEVLIARKCQGI